MPLDVGDADVFEAQRSYLFSIAYRLLGSVGDAEDAVQDAFLRWELDRDAAVRSPRAYLATIVVRLCMDQLRSARARREVYVGSWLPEPLITTDRADLTDTVVLREVFDYDYAEITEMVDKSAANCRQILHRARQRLGERQAGFEPSREQHQQISEQF